MAGGPEDQPPSSATLIEAASAAAWLIDRYNREMDDPVEVAQRVFETMREVMERGSQR